MKDIIFKNIYKKEADKMKRQNVILKFKLTFVFVLFLLFLSSCSDNKNPVSPSNEDINNNDIIVSENISFTVTIKDPIPTAFLNNFAKLFDQNEDGLVEIKINNNNTQSVQLKMSFEILQYTDEIYETLTIASKGSETVFFTPVLSDETLNKFNELKTVQCSVKAILINKESENEIFNQTYTKQMLAKDVMIWGDDFELLPLVVTWVTPHVSEIEELISKAKKYHPENEFIGYQNSESEDGYARGQKFTVSYTIEVPAGQNKKNEIYISTNWKNCVISCDFIASGGFGDDIKVYLESGDGETLYDSGQIHHDSFSININETGYYHLIFDNSFSWLFSRTVFYEIKITYDEDLILPQVKAIYEALKYDYDIDYVNSPISYPDEGTQRIRLPQDALKLGSANCIDGTVLFASALENIGLEPLIVLIPSHAFVGWRRWTGSNVAEFLETTMIGSSSFEEAYNEGNKKYLDNLDKNDIEIVDVKYVRDNFGFTPLMKNLAGK